MHWFHIPVMGTGFTIDTPLRVARFGIDSVVSLVDDVLIERMRRHYCRVLGLSYRPVGGGHPRARSERIRLYLDLMQDQIDGQVAAIRAQPIGCRSEKDRYFQLLPGDSPGRKLYEKIQKTPPGGERSRWEESLREHVRPGAVDVNIMTKLDRRRFAVGGEDWGSEWTDAKTALRGFAESGARGAVVFSAGMNPTLYGFMEQFPQFYSLDGKAPAKGIILKVSDIRSCETQGKFLARKGLHVREFRIESGVNCGGHAFVSAGRPLGLFLGELKARKPAMETEFRDMIERYYLRRGWPRQGWVSRAGPIRVTVQGGLGTGGENRRMREGYGVDGVGWASPFLLVPEVTRLDSPTREKLELARGEDIYLSDASPLGIPFYNLRGSSSEIRHRESIDRGRPGSPCPKGFLAASNEFGEIPLCTASREYQRKKLHALGFEVAPGYDEAAGVTAELYAKQCICHHLGNGALMDAGATHSVDLPSAVCPGPNLAWFDREYALEEMVDAIYGRGPSLVPPDRPHVLLRELELYLDYVERESDRAARGRPAQRDELIGLLENVQEASREYRKLCDAPAFRGENLEPMETGLSAVARRVMALRSRLSGDPEIAAT